MNDYLVSSKLSFDAEQAGDINFAEISPITERVLRDSGDSSLMKLLDPDKEKAKQATLKLMSEYYAVAQE